MFRSTESFTVIGVDFKTRQAPIRRAEISMSVPGDQLTLKRERFLIGGHPAVGVYSARGRQIGYIWPHHAHLLLEFTRVARAIYQSAETFGAVVRVTVDGSLPTIALPKPKPRLIMPPREPRDEFCDIFAQRSRVA